MGLICGSQQYSTLILKSRTHKALECKSSIALSHLGLDFILRSIYRSPHIVVVSIDRFELNV